MSEVVKSSGKFPKSVPPLMNRFTEVLIATEGERVKVTNMVIENAILEVDPSQTEKFEAAFGEAILLLRASPGSQNARLERCVEKASRYQLVVEWASLESHTEVFRNSPLYEQFRDLLMPFYVEKPSVSHYEIVLTST